MWRRLSHNVGQKGQMHYLKLYGLEAYLFKDVTMSFRKNRMLSAFEFFCSIIWKANRAKSKVALKLLEHAGGTENDLGTVVGRLTSAIANAQTDDARMRYLDRGLGVQTAHGFSYPDRALPGFIHSL